MGTKHFSSDMRRTMDDMKATGQTHRVIGEKVGLEYKQVKKYFERQNKKARTNETYHPTKKKGRPRKKPVELQEAMTLRIKELEREVELLRSFLHACGRG